MSEPRPTGFLPYEKIRTSFANHPVRHSDVPLEYFLSFPIPTMRWPRPGYAGFAAAASRRPGRPLRLATPDRWWLLAPDRRLLLAFCRTDIVPFADLDIEMVSATTTRGSAEETDQDVTVYTELMGDAAPLFLAGERADPELRSDLAEAFTAVVPPEIVPWYRALTPDFFTWLEG